MSGVDFDVIDMGLGDSSITPWGGESEPVVPGTYRFRVTDATIETSKKGNPTLVPNAAIIAEERDGQ